MARFGFCGGSYQADSLNADAQITVNLYPENDGSGWGKSQVSMLPSPGLRAFASLPGSSMRGAIEIQGRVFVVVDANFWEVFQNGSALLRNASTPFYGSGNVSMCASPLQILILAGQTGYCYNLTTNSFQALQTYIPGTGAISGASLAITPGQGGSGYAVNDVVTPKGGNGDARVTVTAITSTNGNGALNGPFAVNNGGKNYQVGDVVLPTQSGGVGGSLVVESVGTQQTSWGPASGDAITAPGAGYTLGQTYQTQANSGSGSGLTLTATSVDSLHGGKLYGASVLNGGTNYAVGDTGTVGNGGATYKITAINAVTNQGVVLTLALNAAGSGYQAAQNVPTSGGHGTGLTIGYNALGLTSGIVSTVSLTTAGSGYQASSGDPVTGGSGSGLQLDFSTTSSNPGSGMISSPFQCAYIDGFFIVLKANSQIIQVSQPYDASLWDPTQVAQISVFSDNIVGILADHRQLWLWGTKESQVYYDSGNTFPFDAIPGGFIEQGSGAAWAQCRLDNSVFWLGQNERGGTIAWRANGYSPARVSNHAVEAQWRTYPEVSDAIGYAWEHNGHAFWQIYFPSANATWVYDAATGMWHERTSWSATYQTFGAHRSAYHVAAFGMHLVGSAASGMVYQMSEGFLDDNGDPIQRIRASPYVFREAHWIIHRHLIIDVEVGLGPQPPLLDGNGNPRSPQLVLQWSDDQGKTWSNGRTLDCGQAGQTRVRVHSWRLGKSRGRIYRVSATDPIPWKFVDAYLEATPGFEVSERLGVQFGKMG